MDKIAVDAQESMRLREHYGREAAVQRTAKFLVNLQAFQIGHEEVVVMPIEGTDMTTSTIPTKEEASIMEDQVREHLTALCGGYREIGLDIRDRFLAQMFDEKGLWPSDEEEK